MPPAAASAAVSQPMMMEAGTDKMEVADCCQWMTQ